MSEDIQIRRDDEQQRYEALIDGQVVGHMTYEVDGDVVVIPHTETDPAHGGKGIGGALVRGSLADIQSGGLGSRRVDPQCPFVASYVEKHPEYQALLA